MKNLNECLYDFLDDSCLLQSFEFPWGVWKLADWGGSFLMVYRNNAGRLGAGFISVCLETCWLGRKHGFYVPG